MDTGKTHVCECGHYYALHLRLGTTYWPHGECFGNAGVMGTKCPCTKYQQMTGIAWL